MQWYYIKEGRQQGPIEEQELFEMAKDGRLRPDYPVWHESMGDNWADASDIAGLFDAGEEPGEQPRELSPCVGRW